VTVVGLGGRLGNVERLLALVAESYLLWWPGRFTRSAPIFRVPRAADRYER